MSLFVAHQDVKETSVRWRLDLQIFQVSLIFDLVSSQSGMVDGLAFLELWN